MPDAPSPELAFELAQAYWPDVEHDPRQLLVVPVGSLEQHGLHLPLDTDTPPACSAIRPARRRPRANGCSPGWSRA